METTNLNTIKYILDVIILILFIVWFYTESNLKLSGKAKVAAKTKYKKDKVSVTLLVISIIALAIPAVPSVLFTLSIVLTIITLPLTMGIVAGQMSGNEPSSIGIIVDNAVSHLANFAESAMNYEIIYGFLFVPLILIPLRGIYINRKIKKSS